MEPQRASAIHRCPKCEAVFKPPRELHSECPRCGIWFHKWNAPLPVAPVMTVEAVEEEQAPPPDSLTYYGRAAVLALVCVWSFFLAADNYTDPEPGFMHSILLPIQKTMATTYSRSPTSWQQLVHRAGRIRFRLRQRVATRYSIQSAALFATPVLSPLRRPAQ